MVHLMNQMSRAIEAPHEVSSTVSNMQPYQSVIVEAGFYYSFGGSAARNTSLRIWSCLKGQFGANLNRHQVEVNIVMNLEVSNRRRALQAQENAAYVYNKGRMNEKNYLVSPIKSNQWWRNAVKMFAKLILGNQKSKQVIEALKGRFTGLTKLRWSSRNATDFIACVFIMVHLMNQMSRAIEEYH